MQGPGGNVSRGLPSGPASTVASGAGRCESGALMHSFGIFLQGLLGVVAFSTLMRFHVLGSGQFPHEKGEDES
uniref:STIM activating enhancer n=1 Tax=Mus musculus TaxID=10090 RepID=A0A2I3BRU1_MOUSE